MQLSTVTKSELLYFSAMQHSQYFLKLKLPLIYTLKLNTKLWLVLMLPEGKLL